MDTCATRDLRRRACSIEDTARLTISVVTCTCSRACPPIFTPLKPCRPKVMLLILACSLDSTASNSYATTWSHDTCCQSSHCPKLIEKELLLTRKGVKPPYERAENTNCNWSRSSGDWIDFDCFEFPLASCLMLPRCSYSFSTFGLIAFRPRCESVIDFNTSVSSQSGERGRSDLQRELNVGTVFRKTVPRCSVGLCRML